MVMAGCTHEPLPEPMVKGEEIVTINATMAPETRVAYDDGTRKLMWESQDELILAGYQGSTYNGNSTFTKNGNGNSFSGKPVTGASTYIAYYPGELSHWMQAATYNLLPTPAGNKHKTETILRHISAVS